jgi:hypothetical protein
MSNYTRMVTDQDYQEAECSHMTAEEAISLINKHEGKQLASLTIQDIYHALVDYAADRHGSYNEDPDYYSLTWEQGINLINVTMTRDKEVSHLYKIEVIMDFNDAGYEREEEARQPNDNW